MQKFRQTAQNHKRQGLTQVPAHAQAGSSPALRVATYGALASLALIVGYIEALMPLPVPIPGIKLGLGNVVVLYALAVMGPRPAFFVSLVKVIASSLLFGSPLVFVFSLAGALLSFAAMAVVIRVRSLSVLGVSLVGGVAHMLGQLAAVALILAPRVALFYLPVLVLAGAITGALVGIVCRMIMRATRPSSLLRRQMRRSPGQNSAAAGNTSAGSAAGGSDGNCAAGSAAAAAVSTAGSAGNASNAAADAGQDLPVKENESCQ